MINLFNNLVGNFNASNDLKLVLASVFFLLLVTEFCRFLEVILDFGIGRRK